MSLSNSFFKLGNEVTQQVIRIIMGSYSSFFLYYYKNKWIKQSIGRFGNVFKFNDDLTPLSNYDDFE